MTGIRSAQRFLSQRNPCVICGGFAALPQGKGTRCFGFLSSDAAYVHCTRPEMAGPLGPDDGGTYAHRLAGPCRCGLEHAAAVARVVRVQAPERDLGPLLERMWSETRRAEGTPVAAYLRNRGLDGPTPAALRCHPHLRHTESGAEWPAMVAAVKRWPSDQLAGLHRTYLDPDGRGKAPVLPVKKSLGAIGGGAVRLHAAGATLCLAEGIETALSIAQATGLPAWSALSASNLPNVVLPPLPLAGEVVIAADPDETGLRYARIAADRWRAAGRSVRVCVPPVGMDFNDLLRLEAAAA